MKHRRRKLLNLFLSLAIAVGLCTAFGVLYPVNAEDTENEKTINVKVTAEQRSDGAEVGVNGAQVSVYSGQGRKGEEVKYIGSFDTKNTEKGDGFAECKIPIPEDIASITDEREKEEKVNDYLSTLTFSAKKKVANSAGVDLTDLDFQEYKDSLFNYYEDGRDNRMQLELHSEKIDRNGNWLGEKLPVGNGKEVDVAFIIDTTGSMDDDIQKVRNNLERFATSLEQEGLDLRMSVIDYRNWNSDGHESATTLHLNDNQSPWYDTVNEMKAVLDQLETDGGGSTDETPIDALDMLIHQNTMKWRSSAHKFAFVLTDEPCGLENSHGYSSLREITDLLREDGIVTSVVNKESNKNSFEDLYETEERFFDINDDYSVTMTEFAKKIIGKVQGDLNLKLSEPRLLVDLSLCYYAHTDAQKDSDGDYYHTMEKYLNNVALELAKSTDGHVLIKRGYIFYTDDRNLFFIRTGDNHQDFDISAMADIHLYIASDEKLNTIRPFTHPLGFFDFGPYNGVNGIPASNWGVDAEGKAYFDHIVCSQISSKTTVHELGHYLMGFYDEYGYAGSRGECIEWCPRSQAGPHDGPSCFGLMDALDYSNMDAWWSKHISGYKESLELSSLYEYTYVTSSTPQNQLTTHWYHYGKPTEAVLKELLTTGKITKADGTTKTCFSRNPGNDYIALYTAQPLKPLNLPHISTKRRAEYDFAALLDGDGNVIDDKIVDLTEIVSSESGNSDNSGKSEKSDKSAPAPYENRVKSAQNLADIAATVNGNALTLDITQNVSGEMHLYRRTSTGNTSSTITELPITNGKASLNLANGRECELTVVVQNGGKYLSNTHTLERSFKSDKGYCFMSSDMTVAGVVKPESEDEYTFLNMDCDFKNGQYVSVNHAVRIISSKKTQALGAVVSVASLESGIDCTTLSWYKFANNVWTKLDTTVSEEQEGLNYIAQCDYNGEGTYVLMAKPAATSALNKITNLKNNPDKTRDGVCNMTFDDSNSNTRYYEFYISESSFSASTLDTAEKSNYEAGQSSYTLDFGQRNRNKDYYVAVIAVGKNGARSPLSDVVKVNTGEADRDSDGIPDWYCDKYLLWPEGDQEKDIAKSDDDKDGLTNLQEYQRGSDPKDRNDPVKQVSVKSVSVTPKSVTLGLKEKKTLTAKIQPADATNKKVQWYVDNDSVVKITGNGLSCKLVALAKGKTKVYAVTEDGGFSARVDVTVTESISLEDPRIVEDSSMNSGQKVTWDCIWFGSYPQKEIVDNKESCGTYGKVWGKSTDYVVDDKLYSKLKSATGWDSKGDLTLNGKKYRRVRESDATFSASTDNYYDWNSSDSYHYFRFDKIKWRVLNVSDGNAFLLADQALDDQRYNNRLTDVTWAGSTMRSWLNGYGDSENNLGTDFTDRNYIDSAFSSAEQGAIVSTDLDNKTTGAYSNDYGGDNTTDKVFLLSAYDLYNTDESASYGFKKNDNVFDEARKCKSSTYAKAMGTWSPTISNYFGNCYWWLRSPGYDVNYVAGVIHDGELNNDGYGVYDGNYGVRPALYLDLSFSKLCAPAGTVCSDGTVKEHIGSATYTLNKEKYPYTGKLIVPDVTVTFDGKTLTRGTDYTISSESKEAGKAVATISGKGDFTGSKTVNFTISPASLAGKKLVLKKSTYTYNAKVQQPTVKTVGGKALKVGTDYTIKYSEASSKAAGTYSLTVTGKGNYTGTSARATYKINKAANKLKVKAKTATIKFKAVKKKAQTLAVSKVITFTNKGQGTKTYTKASGNKKITINKKTCKVTVKKGLKKGTYKVKVKVKAAGNTNYKAATKAVTFKVRVS